MSFVICSTAILRDASSLASLLLSLSTSPLPASLPPSPSPSPPLPSALCLQSRNDTSSKGSFLENAELCGSQEEVASNSFSFAAWIKASKQHVNRGHMIGLFCCVKKLFTSEVLCAPRRTPRVQPVHPHAANCTCAQCYYTGCASNRVKRVNSRFLAAAAHGILLK